MTKKEFNSLKIGDKVLVDNRVDFVEDIQRRDSDERKGGMILISKSWTNYENVQVLSSICLLELQKQCLENAIRRGQVEPLRLDSENNRLKLMDDSLKAFFLECEEFKSAVRNWGRQSRHLKGVKEYKEELADMVIVLLTLAELLDVNLGKVIVDKIDYNKTRKD